MSEAAFQFVPGVAPLIPSGTTLDDILSRLAERMSETQRHAFLQKMAALDREIPHLSPAAVTLGRA